MRVAQTTHRWLFAEADRAQTRVLADALGIPPIVAHLLLLRGVETPDQARRFLRPALAHLSDPLLLTDMQKAVDRITQARAAGEHVRIFGDYDVDGISAMAILINGFKRFGLDTVSYGMPHRLLEGYGLSVDHIDLAASDGVSLIVTVDNGISAHEAARRARELGIALIVTDHHSIEDGLPEAVAVINPKRETAEHPAYPLCGAGVAFKLSTALNGTPNDLDIAALGTVADIVPLLGENRAIVALGLRHIMKHARLGLERLAAAAGITLDEISSEKIGFQLGPRLNAAGRLDEGLTALHLLLCEDNQEASRMARALNEANEERRAIEKEIYDQAVEELDACFSAERRGIVLARRGWHAGVIGIVAARIETRYHRPVVMINIDEDGIGRGSGRGGPGFDLVGAFNACQHWLELYGGHRSAAGLTIREENIEGFRKDFEAEALRQLGSEDIIPELTIHAVASFSQIDGNLLRQLESLEPHGHENPAPVFCSTGVELVPQSVRILKDKHLKLMLRQDQRVFGAIGFQMAERYYLEDMPPLMDIAYTPQFNTFRNETSIQLVLRDIRPSQGTGIEAG